MDWDDIDQGFLPAVVYGPPSVAEPVAEQPVEGRPEGATDCDGVCKDGTYFGRGAVVNGKFVGFTGPCFRCGGKGWQNDADRRRNWGYDQNRRFTL
jgi:hypothetical protein